VVNLGYTRFQKGVNMGSTRVRSHRPASRGRLVRSEAYTLPCTLEQWLAGVHISASLFAHFPPQREHFLRDTLGAFSCSMTKTRLMLRLEVDEWKPLYTRPTFALA